MITIVARCSIQSGKSDEFMEIARDLVDASRREDGNISYDLYVDLADPAKFAFIEVWKDRAAIDSHNETAHFKGFGERAGPLFAGPLDIGLYRKVV
ncbi:putative quinol monooxygenase [Methanoculleus horonobensis]|jgi:quinol monooxygenase YgiN|uniref:putative quinol monooxygenase n=1 Tax=Methanoculleus horonobensis TaxID=528314 RepID=UPI00082E1434|nr:putative quinol monooxygenase [Methanoculleus horonobensis]MDD3069689.1 putative quinol monooxygenase [Methanoculleus horonobensis]MDD4252242.1 putative quinol monooxygenase [Methanoculleus horonobensis]